MIQYPKICIISFVGKYSETRIEALEDIKNRIETGQVDFGVLVFKRGKGGTDNSNTFHEAGSKAWVNSLLKINNKAIFIDDSEDHVLSVRSANIENLKVIHIDNSNIKKFNIAVILAAVNSLTNQQSD